ncbi:MAG: TonB-dependent receptor [Acidobacteria bacterium]|nr:TonB-dependent receptor [Acidobacteriota bacterium]
MPVRLFLNGGDPAHPRNPNEFEPVPANGRTPPSSVARGGPLAPLRSLAIASKHPHFSTLLVVAVLFSLPRSIAEAATLRGTMLDPDGRAVARARLAITSPLIGSRETLTDATGTFRFDHIPEGSYEVLPLVDGFRADPLIVRVAADQEQVVTVRLRITALSESIVVTASQIERPLSQTAESLTVLTKDDFAGRQLESVTDALRLVPGLGVTRSGGRGALTSIFPRGGESDFTLVLVDGFPINLFGGGLDFSMLPIEDIERIETVRGPQSALFGANAIGSVVQIVTGQGAGPLFGGLLEGGSFETTRLAARTQGAQRGWSWSLGGERFASDGFTGATRATNERVSNDDSLLKHASAGLGWAGGQGDIRARARWTTSDRGFPGPFGSDPRGFFGGVDRISRGETEARLFSISGSRAWGTAVRTRVQAGHFKQHGMFVSSFGSSTSDTRRSTVRVQADVIGRGGIDLSGGTEVQREQAASTFITGAQFQEIPIERRIVGSFAEARYGQNGRLFITGGVRVEHIRRNGLEPNPSIFSPRPAFDANVVTSVNPKISGAFFVAPPSDRGWTKLRLSAGTGIRPPDAFEIAFTDNPSLKPERSRSLEVGAEQAFLAGRFVFEGTAFFNQYDDLIVAVGRSLRDASRFRTDNISNARARGVEISAAWRSTQGLHVRTGYTWLDTEILAVDRSGSAPPPFTPGDPLLRRPRHQGYIDALFVRGGLTSFARLKARGPALDVEPSFGATFGLFNAAGFGVIDIGAAAELTRHLEIFGRIDNVSDRFYEEALGFPAIGRSLTIGIRVASPR